MGKVVIRMSFKEGERLNREANEKELEEKR
jgi:hypothetical protein